MEERRLDHVMLVKESREGVHLYFYSVTVAFHLLMLLPV